MATRDQFFDSGRTEESVGAKYLSFFLDSEEYGIEILDVREIIGLMAITPVPQAPHYVRGIINLRGRLIPVVDLRLKFGMPGIPDTSESCTVVVEANGALLGVVVDRVSEVLELAGEDVVEAPTLGREINTEFLLGIGKHQGRVVLLLDIQKVFSGDDLSGLAAVA